MTDAAAAKQLERSIRLIPVHRGFASAYVWIPVAVLYTRARFDLDGAVLLSSIYYLSVVILEVPSGWMSDRLGRVITLRAAAFSWIAANLCFLIGGNSFTAFAIGQLFLAGGFASLSGTDVSFHYDALEAAGRAQDYARRQARVSSIGFMVTAISAVAGGVIGLVDLRLAFLAALLLAVGQLAVALMLTEPPGRSQTSQGIGVQLRSCVAYLRSRFLAWIFFYGIVLVTLEHVAVTVLQPWLTEVFNRSADDLGATPLFSGLVYAGFSLVGAMAARASAPLAERFGTVAVLIGLGALSATIVSGMAIWTSAAVLVLVAFRSAQGAAAPVLISAAVAPVVERGHRATLLSLNSLAGRLGFGLLLALISGVVADDVQRVLMIFSVLAWALVIVLIASALLVREPAPPSGSPAR